MLVEFESETLLKEVVRAHGTIKTKVGRFFSSSNSLYVIPIVGMEGLGKSTLAKFVFNDKRIHECFPLKMWVCVSEDFHIKQLVIKIINSDSAFLADAPDPQLNFNILYIEQLQKQLRNKLAGTYFSWMMCGMKTMLNGLS